MRHDIKPGLALIISYGDCGFVFNGSFIKSSIHLTDNPLAVAAHYYGDNL